MKRVYVAGPYTKGDVAVNVRVAIDAADELLNAGFAPYVPHFCHFWHMHHPHGWKTWLALDKEWLLVCEVMIRLQGDSTGADLEREWAENAGIPVYDSVSEFMLTMTTGEVLAL